MPNTNPTDLDREALKAALGAWTWQMSYTSGEIEENLQSAVQAYLAALLRTSGAPSGEIEPVAWITKSGLRNWQRGAEAEPHILLRSGNDLRVPLYLASPSPIASEPKDTGSGEWQPIETAPKDGTLFIALQDSQRYPCEWHLEEYDEGAPQEGWFDHLNQSFEEPTHWHALPALPITRTAPSGAKP